MIDFLTGEIGIQSPPSEEGGLWVRALTPILHRFDLQNPKFQNFNIEKQNDPCQPGSAHGVLHN